MSKLRFPIAVKTDEVVSYEWGESGYVFTGPVLSETDDRVQLEDDTICYVWNSPLGTLPELCTELVAMDAGDNVIRRFIATKRSTQGITAPAIPKTNVYLTAVPADGSFRGHYREKKLKHDYLTGDLIVDAENHE